MTGSLTEQRRQAVERIEELVALQDRYQHPARTAELRRLRELVASIDVYLENAA